MNNFESDNTSKISFLNKPFPLLRHFNFGIFLISMYIIQDFGSFTSLFSFLNYTFRLPLIVAASTVLYAFYLVITRQFRFDSSMDKVFFLMCAYIIVYSALSTKIPTVKSGLIKGFIYYLSAYIVFIRSVKTIPEFFLILDIWLASIAFSCYNGIFQGGLVWGNKWLADENELALISSIALPIALILYINYKSKIKIFCYFNCLIVFVVASIVSVSRGGMLSLATSVFLCWFLLKKKIKFFFIFILATLCLYHFAPPKYFEEMNSLRLGTREATADSRMYFWEKGFEMLKDNPFFGVGPNNYPYFFPIYDNGERYATPEMRPPHSFPIQWLAEMGIIGFFILLVVQYFLYKNWRHKYIAIFSNGNIPSNSIMLFSNIHNAIAISLIAFWVGSLFLSLMAYPFFWFLIYFSESWKNISLSVIDISQEKEHGD